MGSFGWDDPCYVKYHNGRPLSVALTEPCNCQSAEPSPFVQSDFMLQYRPRSQSSGRKYKHESYRVFHPNVQYTAFCYSPPFSRRMMDHSSARDVFVEKLETVEIEEQCRPNRCCTSYVRTPSPPVRQVKIRSRPSSCVNLHKQEATDNQWTKIVDERHEEHYDWHYNITLPIQRESSSTIIGQSAATRTNEDLRIPVTSKFRPSTRDVGTITDVLLKKPVRPLSISETQVLDRYEKKERIRRDSITTDTGSFSYTVSQRPINHSSDDEDDDNSDRNQAKRSSKKAHRKEFVQRMHARNGTTWKSYNALNVYSDRGNNQLIVRPTAKPREALVDSPSIVALSSESDLPPAINIETSYRTRNYLQPF